MTMFVVVITLFFWLSVPLQFFVRPVNAAAGMLCLGFSLWGTVLMFQHWGLL